MKMCLAPCFAGCTPGEYADEVSRVTAFLRSGGTSLADTLAQERESASARLDFEQASALHRRLEKVQELRRALPEVVRPIEQLHALIVMRAAAENTIALFIVRGGRIADPFLLPFTEVASQPRSTEQILRELLEPTTPQPSETDSQHAGAGLSDTQSLEDHLALIARWFYASPREGEILFQEPRPIGWPYRRILRACKRVLAADGADKADKTD
jgi:excinuclease ABC subunit C